MAEDTFTKEQLDKAVEDAIAKNNAKRDEDEKGLKAKVDELLNEAKAAKEAKTKAEEAAAAKAEEAARKAGDVEALEKSWQKKLDDAISGANNENAQLKAAVESLTKGAAAKTLAAEMAVEGSASVLERVILDRLSVENADDGPLVRVLDKDGKPSAANLVDLKTELSADKALAPLIAASKASGGGAAGANGGAGNTKTADRATFDGMSQGERAAFIKDGGKVVEAT